MALADARVNDPLQKQLWPAGSQPGPCHARQKGSIKKRRERIKTQKRGLKDDAASEEMTHNSLLSASGM